MLIQGAEKFVPILVPCRQISFSLASISTAIEPAFSRLVKLSESYEAIFCTQPSQSHSCI